VLRKKGLAAASNKSARRAAEGLVGLQRTSSNDVAIVEINSETDFVARNEQFQRLVSSAATAVLNCPPPDIVTLSGQSSHVKSFEVDASTLNECSIVPGGPTLQEAVANLAGTVRENLRLRRAFRLAAHLKGSSPGVCGTYVHASVGSGLGRIAGAVLMRYEAPDGQTNIKILEDFSNKLAMHVVGAVPRYLDTSAVPDATLEAEKKVLREQASTSGKPANIVEKMVQGRLKKYYQEVCLVEQPYIHDDKISVAEAIQQVQHLSGVSDLKVTGFVRVQVGEGLENEGADGAEAFAAEVAATLNQHS
jgi:elongation factor Ts